MSLAKVLRDVRAVRGDSLRAVEESTGISNTYLSQLERGDAAKPSPDKLMALAKYYGIPYNDLMRAAGYLIKSEPANNKVKDTSAAHAALMSADLTPEEEDAVVKYIQFLRFHKPK